jgi:quercetin dioxygenase-like cupin family protein
MAKNLCRLAVASALFCFVSLGSLSYARESPSPVKVEQLLQTSGAWDGTGYSAYPAGQPQITVLKITVPANTALAWHQHPMISAAYVVSGELFLEKKDTGEHMTFHAGQALTETVNTIHRGYTKAQPVELIVFYAGSPGMPLSIKTN